MRAWIAGAYQSDGYEWYLLTESHTPERVQVELSEEEFADYERACEGYHNWQNRLYDMQAAAAKRAG